MLTICLLVTLAIFAIVFACTVGAAGAIVFVLFGDVIIAIALIALIRKVHTYFKTKNKIVKK